MDAVSCENHRHGHREKRTVERRARRAGRRREGRPQVTSNCGGPLSVTSGIALCAEKPSGKGLITIVMRIPSDTNEYTRVLPRARERIHGYTHAWTHARASKYESCKYVYYRVVYTSSLLGLHYILISLREPCWDGLYKWWLYDNAVTLTTEDFVMAIRSPRIEYATRTG